MPRYFACDLIMLKIAYKAISMPCNFACDFYVKSRFLDSDSIAA